jgi:hypothetical protein
MTLRRTLAALAVALVVGLAALVGVLRLGWLKPPHSGLTTGIAWAVGIPGDLYNFGVVVPGRVYRSAEPDERFIRYVYERHGVRRVISLNGDQPYQAIARELGMSVDLYDWKPFHRPGDDQLKRVLDTLDDGTPVLVHCTYGRDRTGYAIDAYRIWRQGWPVNRTLEELERFGHSPDETPWIDTTLSFFESEPRQR